MTDTDQLAAIRTILAAAAPQPESVECDNGCSKGGWGRYSLYKYDPLCNKCLGTGRIPAPERTVVEMAETVVKRTAMFQSHLCAAHELAELLAKQRDVAVAAVAAFTAERDHLAARVAELGKREAETVGRCYQAKIAVRDDPLPIGDPVIVWNAACDAIAAAILRQRPVAARVKTLEGADLAKLLQDREREWQIAADKGVAEAVERCAKIVEQYEVSRAPRLIGHLAAAIRATAPKEPTAAGQKTD